MKNALPNAMTIFNLIPGTTHKIVDPSNPCKFLPKIMYTNSKNKIDK